MAFSKRVIVAGVFLVGMAGVAGAQMYGPGPGYGMGQGYMGQGHMGQGYMGPGHHHMMPGN